MSAMLDYWHPVLPSAELPRASPVGITLAGTAIVVFRAEDGKLGALEDKCAHRRMKLSVGQVRDAKVICPYHGWSFDCEGQGTSPSAPKMKATITSYDCAEVAGVVWIKARTSRHELHPPSMEGWQSVGAVFNRVPAPLELVIDNFSEIEHTVTTHPDFGFAASGAGEAVVELETTEDSVTVRNRGPAKMPPLDTRLVIGIRHGDQFHSNYTFHFDPPRSSVAHFWTDSRTACERLFKYHVFHYFVPTEPGTTLIVTFGFLQIRSLIFRPFGSVFGWFFRRKLRRTVDEDAWLLKNLADKSTSLEGMKLSRFDSILGLTRERLRRIYHGVDQGRA